MSGRSLPIEDTNAAYAEDEILTKLEIALADSSGDIKSDIRAAIADRKRELRSE